MEAFHGDPKIKEKYLKRLKEHAKLDQIIKGKYWENGKGCAVGCTIHASDHKQYEIELGIPMIIARLEDRIFEGLPLKKAKTWPLRFLKSIKVGADLSLIWDQFASRLLTDPIGGIIQYAKTEEQLEVIQRVSDLYKARIIGIEVDQQDFRDAAAASYASYAASYASYAASYASYAASYASDAASYASYAASYASYASYAASYASDAASYAVADAASYASDAAADAVADAARENAYLFQSELLLELLRKAKPAVN